MGKLPVERARTVQSSMLLNELEERGDGEETEFVEQNKVIWNKKAEVNRKELQKNLLIPNVW